MEKRIKIDEKASAYVEKLFFEYNARLNILRYLMSQSNVKVEYLSKYQKEAESKNMELELAKKEISNVYKPSKGANCYEFDFDNCEIIYRGEFCD